MRQEPRLQFTKEERADPVLEKPIRKADRAADKAEKARAKIPKKKIRFEETVTDPATGKTVTRLRFEEVDKKKPPSKLSHAVRDAPGNAILSKVHKEIRESEEDNVGVESAHKAELLTEAGVHKATRYTKRRIREHPARQVEKWEHKTMKANANLHYQQMVQEHPELQSSFLSRMAQKWKIKREYAKQAREAARQGAKAAGAAATTTEKTVAYTSRFVRRHKSGVIIILLLFCLFLILNSVFSALPSLGTGMMNAVVGTSYTAEDEDILGANEDYTALENELRQKIANIEHTHPGYDEYRYQVDELGHNPYELTSYLIAKLRTYTRENVQGELRALFEAQYKLTLTEEVEIRYRTETSTDPETGKTTTEEVPYEYYILNVKLTYKPISELAEELLTPQQLEMFHVYLETSGNKPLIFGGGSPDGSPSEDLSGVEFVNGTRPGNPELMELAKQQVGNVGGYPYWSWYGFNSRVEWCACFVSWCYNQAGKSEPRFAGCEWQGVPWFQSRGQWGARGYENIAPGDAIFFDWDLDGVADHVGLVLGRDGSHVYTVEGNSGDACKIKSYDLNYQCIKGYGLMNW